MDAIGIGKSQHNDYFVMQDGRIVGGPFKTKEQAEAAKISIETEPPRQLAALSICQADDKSAHGYWICIDNKPTKFFASRQEFEQGVLALAAELRAQITIDHATDESADEFWVCFGGKRHTRIASMDEAESVRKRLETELANLAIVQTSELGGFWLLFDGEPVIRVESEAQARAHLQAIELGSTCMASWLRQSLGMGDAIALSGAAVVLAEREGGIILPTRPENLASVKSLFINHPNIELQDADQFLKHIEPNNLFIQFDHLWWRETYLDQYRRIYQHFDIEYKHCWESSPVQLACMKVKQLSVPDGQYIFLHEAERRKYLIDRTKLPSLPVYEPEFVPGQSILAFKEVIENATQIHTMDSCFFHLLSNCNRVANYFCTGIRDRIIGWRTTTRPATIGRMCGEG
jgi:hypothetical protein